jgi:hypothetical protein
MARLVAPCLLAALLVAACNETPRGEQGIDDVVEGGEDAASPTTDAHGPCQNEPFPSQQCLQQGGSGTLYTHLVLCEGGETPFLLDCNGTDASTVGVGGADDAGTAAFCCTTGLI